MPIYEFDCRECGKPFESLVLGFSTDNVRCPDCDSQNVKKKISSFAVKGGQSASIGFNTSAAACSTGST
jgi:putative FmdB family regulatory protein